MRINRGAIKADARALCKSASPSPILVGLVYAVILVVLGALQTQVSLKGVDTGKLMGLAQSGNIEAAMNYAMASAPGPMANILNILIQVMSAIIGVGFTIFCIQTARGLTAVVGNLFDGFGQFFRILGLLFMQWLFIALWTLLLVVPGIIAAYRYRMAIYILLDNPEMGIMDCIRESKAMMTGRKGELFVLDMSFIGWALLCLLPSELAIYAPVAIGYVLTYVVATLAYAWLYAYTGITEVFYYDALRGLTHGDALPGGPENKDSWDPEL